MAPLNLAKMDRLPVIKIPRPQRGFRKLTQRLRKKVNPAQ